MNGNILLKTVILFAFVIGASQIRIGSNPGFAAANAETIANLDETTDRYQLKWDGDYFVRLDKQTGEMSLCQRSDAKLICRLAADEQKAMQDEIASLQQQLDLARQGSSDDRAKTKKPLAKKPEEKSFPELDKELDQFMAYSSKVLRKFFTVMKDLKEDFKQQQ